jgi:septal ring factor EnvC (AmiA/AmiB activator)
MSQQLHEIPIAAEVVIGSSFYDQELDQRISNTQSEIQDKDNQIMTVEKEINGLQTSLAPIFGVAFMRK